MSSTAALNDGDTLSRNGANTRNIANAASLPLASSTDAMLFFQLMGKRYERASTVLTSNKSFAEWGDVFGDEVIAAALIDRLVHHCHVVNIRGNSYRMRHHADLRSALASHGGERMQATLKRRTTRREAQAS